MLFQSMNSWPLPQVHVLLQAIVQLWQAMHLFVSMIIVNCRFGLALGLSDVDFLRRRVVLHENAVAVGGRTHVGTLKSGHHRSVALPAFVVDELAATCAGKDRDELIWPARDGGYLAPPTNKSWLAGAVQRCQKADKTFPRVTAHALGHTAASLAIASGANPKVVQRMLGHAPRPR